MTEQQREAYNAYARKYYQAHKDLINARHRERNKRNPIPKENLLLRLYELRREDKGSY
jgi:hypothetical protein